MNLTVYLFDPLFAAGVTSNLSPDNLTHPSLIDTYAELKARATRIETVETKKIQEKDAEIRKLEVSVPSMTGQSVQIPRTVTMEKLQYYKASLVANEHAFVQTLAIPNTDHSQVTMQCLHEFQNDFDYELD